MKQVKKCSKCGGIKPLAAFRKSARGKNGLRGECRDCETAREKKYYQEHKAAILKQKKKYQQEHKEEIAARVKVYCQTPSGKMARKKGEKRYKQTPNGKETSKRHRHKQRAQKMGVLYEIFDPVEIFERDGWRCQHCHKKVQWYGESRTNPLYPNLDHIVCLANGGEHTRRNTQLLCRACNNKKGTNDVGEQLRLLG
ncbi:MAG: HNH endonuclease signature motif containing protein [Synergistaceae bacterium]|jgi:5-methylcytosine-specific restriction endonuclease McrA